MNNDVPLEDKLFQLNDIMVHIGFIIKAGHKLVKKLMIAGEEYKARQLLFRILNHDRSKVSEIEFYGMARYSKDIQSMIEPNKGHSPVLGKMEIIQHHWDVNDHHPEFWIEGEVPKTLAPQNPSKISEDMNELAIMEMCCDLYARSLQFGNSVIDFYENQQNKRWIFSEKQDKLIRKYFGMLMED